MKIPEKIPDNITTLAQRWPNVSNSVGPTLNCNVGPTYVCHLAQRWANVGKSATLAQRWPNVGKYATLAQQWPNVGTLDDWPSLGHRGATVGLPCNAGTAVLQCYHNVMTCSAGRSTTLLKQLLSPPWSTFPRAATPG